MSSVAILTARSIISRKPKTSTGRPVYATSICSTMSDTDSTCATSVCSAKYDTDNSYANQEVASPGHQKPSLRRRFTQLYRSSISLLRKKKHDRIRCPDGRQHDNQRNGPEHTHAPLNLLTGFPDRLPPELTRYIVEYLDHPDMFCLALGSRQLYSVLSGMMNKNPVDAQTFPQIEARLERDRFHRMIAEEESLKNPRNQKQLLCSSCHNRHKSSAFTPAQRLNSPIKRLCFGAEGRFHLCSHKSFTFVELRTELASSLNGNPITCSRHLPCSAYSAKLFVPPSGIVASQVEFILFEISVVEKVTCNRMRSAIAELYEPLCPHQHTSDPGLFERLHEVAKSRHTTNDSDIFYKAYCTRTLILECAKPDCDTTIRVERKGGVVELRVTRRLGRLYTATDARWCAQLV